MKTLVRTMVSSSEHEKFHFNQTLVGWMHLNKKPLIINDPKRDDRFQGIQWDESVRSLIAVPMMVKSELRGVLTVYNKKAEASFTDDDQRLLAIIAAQSGQVVENARLYEQEQALVRMQEEIRLASKIQLELLPQEFPNVPGYEIVGRTIPAQTVGGDYFDFIPIDSNRIAICLGDVSGKGLPASLLMANLQATLRGQTLLNVPPRQCLERSNRLLFQSTSPEKFATLFYGILDATQHRFVYTNAGQDHPFVLRKANKPLRLDKGGIPLAMMGEFVYEDDAITIEPGEVIVMYSDGITEAMNAAEEMFTEQRVAETLQAHQNGSAKEILEKLTAAANAHAGNTPQSDDMTVVVVKRVQ